MPHPFILAATGATEHPISLLLAALAAVLFLTKILGDLAQRIGQPAVLGELLAGVLLGPSVIGLLDPTTPVIYALGELGVLILLFQIGLHTDLKAILKVGAPAAVVGIVGVVLPFAGGYGAANALGLGGLTAIVCGAALTATSIGISARVLSDLGQLETEEGRIVLGAAVLDDVIGLIILSVVSGLAAGGAFSLGGVAQIAGIAVGFLVVAIAVGTWAAPAIVRLADRMRVDGALGALSLGFGLALAAAAVEAGSAMIIGGFAAGLVLHATPKGKEIEKATTALGHFFVPIFFATVGAAINLRSLGNRQVLMIGGVLCVVAIVGKLLSGFAPWWFKGKKMLIGVAMIPRGEVGLIFAQMGLATGALTEGLFSAVVLMVMVTTFIAPPWLTALAGRPPVPAVGDHGLDDLVSGER
jgi:Kef-type K+ transport system membrane component KefB